MEKRLRPVKEQQGDENLIGPPGSGQIFDNFLYESMGYSITEDGIGNKQFWENYEDKHIHQLISSLQTMCRHCNRVTDKLRIILRIKKSIADPKYIPEPGDTLLIPDVSEEENSQGVVIKGGLAAVLDSDGLGKIWFYGFPDVPFRISHVLQHQMAWMNDYGLRDAERVEKNLESVAILQGAKDPEEPPQELMSSDEVKALRKDIRNLSKPETGSAKVPDSDDVFENLENGSTRIDDFDNQEENDGDDEE